VLAKTVEIASCLSLSHPDLRMPTVENPYLLQISALLAGVFPHIPANSMLARLVSPEDFDFACHRKQSRLTLTDLAETEHAVLGSFKLPKRRAQWLTGRLCAKEAIIGYCRKYLPHIQSPPGNALQIRNTSTGRPELRKNHLPAELQQLDISISHSGDYAAALVSDSVCGIDIQERSDTLGRVRDRFCSREEGCLLDLHIPGLDHLGRLSMLWAAKEAVKKAFSSDGMPGFLDFMLTGIKVAGVAGFVMHFSQANHPFLMRMPLQVAVTFFDDYALAVCLPRVASNA
jgi:4'-phosphopantetheinyl transferase